MHKKVLKGTKWMPRRILPMKDVEDCDKLRVAVNKLWSGDLRMGKPSMGNAMLSITEYIGYVNGNQLNWNILVGWGKESK